MTLERAREIRQKMHEKFLMMAKEYAATIRKTLGRATVILYGSIVRGDFNRASDVDILVVSDNLPKDFLKRFGFLLEKAAVGIEPKGYTTKEFLLIKNKRNFIEMLKNRIVLVYDFRLFA